MVVAAVGVITSYLPCSKTEGILGTRYQVPGVFLRFFNIAFPINVR